MQCAAVSYVSEAQHFSGINTNKFFRKWWCASQFNSFHILQKKSCSKMSILSIYIFILYLQILAILQLKLSTNAARKIWENRLITPGPRILSWFIDVGGCESSNYQILGSKDIKRHQKKPCHNDIQKNHSTKNASWKKVPDIGTWSTKHVGTLGCSKKYVLYSTLPQWQRKWSCLQADCDCPMKRMKT